MSNYYNPAYFDSAIFNVDYAPIAKAILKEYHPKTLIEFGCGNGELSKSLSQQDDQIHITAIDGYATPDFTKHKQIEFKKIDLNEPASVQAYLTSLNKKFDVAICMEVAEHLKPEVSGALIDSMTSVADAVIFSAAVPHQDGEGHINCRNRIFWHQQFEKNNFMLRDTIRSQIRHNPGVAKWYALNTVDYKKAHHPPTIEEYKTLVNNLVESESEASSNFYFVSRGIHYKNHLLQLDIIRQAFRLRNFIKKLVGKKTLSIDN